MQVAELVPEVSVAQCFAIGGSDVPAPGDRFEHHELHGQDCARVSSGLPFPGGPAGSGKLGHYIPDGMIDPANARVSIQPEVYENGAPACRA